MLNRTRALFERVKNFCSQLSADNNTQREKVDSSAVSAAVGTSCASAVAVATNPESDPNALLKMQDKTRRRTDEECMLILDEPSTGATQSCASAVAVATNPESDPNALLKMQDKARRRTDEECMLILDEPSTGATQSCASAVAVGQTLRVGIGYDVHPLAPQRPLVLGGLTIPHPDGKGLAGHSDADVLSHAIADAILGASGKRDIGYYFPNTDASLKNISSLIILKKVAALLAQDHGKIINIDATLIAEEPKIAPFIEAMRISIAGALQLDPSLIGLKATTNEGLGCLGRGEGIAAIATAAVEMLRSA